METHPLFDRCWIEADEEDSPSPVLHEQRYHVVDSAVTLLADSSFNNAVSDDKSAGPLPDAAGGLFSYAIPSHFVTMVSQELADTVMQEWLRSKAWRNSAMQHNEWTKLPLPVLDVIFRHVLGFGDLRSVALVCKTWKVAAMEKVPFSKEIFAENARAMEQKRQREFVASTTGHRPLRRPDCEEIQLFLLGFGLCSIATAAFLVLGLTGLLYFVPFVESVSTVPDCPSATSMTASLFFCCAFWLLDATLAFSWSVVVTCISWPCNCRVGSRRCRATLRGVIVLLNGCGICSNFGVWSSAAACIHYCNACMDLNPVVAVAVRAFAVTSLTVGLIVNIIGVCLEFAAIFLWRQ